MTTRTPGPLAQLGIKLGAPPLVMLKVPSPLEKAMGMVLQPGVCLTRAMSVRPLPLKSPATTRTPGWFAQLGIKLGAPPLVMLKVPSPLEKAMGMVLQPGVCLTRAMSVRPLPLKSPATTRTPGWFAQLGIKLGAPPLVMLKVPSPLEKAMGMVLQPGVCLTRAMSVRPLPLKSPATTRTPGWFAQLGIKLGAPPLVMLKVPSPLEKAMGIVLQPGVCLTRAMSVRPLPLKSPATTRTPGWFAQLGIKLGAPPVVMLKVPSPLEKAMGIVLQPGVFLTRAMSVRPLPLKSPATTRTPGWFAQLGI